MIVLLVAELYVIGLGALLALECAFLGEVAGTVWALVGLGCGLIARGIRLWAQDKEASS